jgi:hypothetical protein
MLMGLTGIKAHTIFTKELKFCIKQTIIQKEEKIKESTRNLALDSGACGLKERRQDNEHIEGFMF